MRERDESNMQQRVTGQTQTQAAAKRTWHEPNGAAVHFFNKLCFLTL